MELTVQLKTRQINRHLKLGSMIKELKSSLMDTDSGQIKACAGG